MHNLVMYTKDGGGCVRCEDAKRLLKTHNLFSEVTVVYASSLYQVTKLIRNQADHDQPPGSLLEDIDIEDNVLGFPVFYDRKMRRVYSECEGLLGQYGEDVLLLENPHRHVLFPIQYPDIWTMYEKAVASFWTVHEIDFSQDDKDFHGKLTDTERNFVTQILAFFAASDGIVVENLARNFSDEIQIPEARAFYSYQQFNETIHSHTYSLMIDRYFAHDPAEKMRLLRAVQHIPSVTKKARWATKWIDRRHENCPSLAERLVAFACVEGILFSGSFCAIFWLKKRGLLHGLTFSNELIARDEGTHQEFAVLLYRQYVRNKLSQDQVYAIVDEAVNHETEFITESIPCRMVGMNDELMKQYIHYVADRLLEQLGYEAKYRTSNPFDFMENISLTGKTNFFERRVGEYARNQEQASMESNAFGLDASF
eukprot:265988-Prorocentrum_minimum.AAC.7